MTYILTSDFEEQILFIFVLIFISTFVYMDKSLTPQGRGPHRNQTALPQMHCKLIFHTRQRAFASFCGLAHLKLISVVVLSINSKLVDPLVKTIKPHLHILGRLKSLQFSLDFFNCLPEILETAS
jgi:hypothetical protein